MKLSKKQQLAFFLETAKLAHKQASSGILTDYHKGELKGLATAYFAVSGTHSGDIDTMINNLIQCEDKG